MYVEKTYGVRDGEKGNIDINFNDEEREKAIESFTSILEEFGIEKAPATIRLLRERRD